MVCHGMAAAGSWNTRNVGEKKGKRQKKEARRWISAMLLALHHLLLSWGQRLLFGAERGHVGPWLGGLCWKRDHGASARL